MSQDLAVCGLDELRADNKRLRDALADIAIGQEWCDFCVFEHEKLLHADQNWARAIRNLIAATPEQSLEAIRAEIHRAYLSELQDRAVVDWVNPALPPRELLAELLAAAARQALDPKISEGAAKLCAEAAKQATDFTVQILSRRIDEAGRKRAALELRDMAMKFKGSIVPERPIASDAYANMTTACEMRAAEIEEEGL